MSFVFVAILIFFLFVCLLKHWKLNVLWLLLQSLHHHFNISFDDISLINVFARNMRSIVYSCKYTFNDYIFNISYTSLFCSFFRNILSFLCLILWLFLIKLIYSQLLRRVFILLLIYISFSCYFSRVLLRFLFIISNAWFRWSFALFSLSRF